MKTTLPDQPLISIVTVVRNGEAFLAEAIRSVLDQDYENIEYIIVDGASTDGTLDIIRTYDERIDYWISEPDRGLYDAMNKGLALAKGDLIGILNADDYYQVGSIRHIVDAALTRPDVGVFHGNLKLLRKNGVEEVRRPRLGKQGYRPYLMPVNHPTVFVRARCYTECGGFDTSYRTAADFDLMLRFLLDYRIRFHHLDQVLACMREGGESGQYNWQTYTDICEILEKRNLTRGAVFRFRLWYLWLLLMQYSKRFRLIRALVLLFYQLRKPELKTRDGRKKVLFVVPSLTGGGGQHVAATLCEAFGAVGDLELILVVFDTEGTRDLDPAIRVSPITVRESGGAIYTLGKFGKVVFQLARLIRQERPQVILGFMDYCNSVTLLANRLAGNQSRVVISVHTLFSAFLQGKGANPSGHLLRILAERLYSRADAVVAVSPGVAEDLTSLFGLAAEKTRVIGNPFDLEKIARLAKVPIPEPLFQEGLPILLSVGRLAPEKDGATLLRAFALLRRQTDARLVFLGEGPERAALEQLCAELGIADEVFFLGYRDNPFQYLVRSSMFVLSSRYEGFGNVLIEAMACGLPVVATRCYPGIEAIVEDGQTGLLVSIGNEVEMAAALARLLDEAGLRRKLVEAGRKKAELFACQRIAASYREVLGLAAVKSA
jgi:glycosyltransferase involved in cell wall biosynthesis